MKTSFDNKSNSAKSGIVIIHYLVIVLSIILAGCGGGGSSGGAPEPATGAAAVVVAAGVATNIPASGGGLEYEALVHLLSQSVNGPEISDATVTINGTALAYSTSSGLYSGHVVPDAAGRLNLSITTAAGDVITASASAITSLPILIMPNPFSSTADNSVSWNRPAGMGPSVMFPEYTIQLKRAVDVYPRYAMVSGTSAIFSAGCCIPGVYTLTLYSRSVSLIPGANSSSTFTVHTTVVTSVNVI